MGAAQHCHLLLALLPWRWLLRTVFHFRFYFFSLSVFYSFILFLVLCLFISSCCFCLSLFLVAVVPQSMLMRFDFSSNANKYIYNTSKTLFRTQTKCVQSTNENRDHVKSIRVRDSKWSTLQQQETKVAGSYVL